MTELYCVHTFQVICTIKRCLCCRYVYVLKNVVFLDVTPYGLTVTDVSDENAASIFSIGDVPSSVDMTAVAVGSAHRLS